MEKYTQATEAINKVVIESNQQLTKALAEVHTSSNRNPHDPNTSHLRQKLSEDLQRENCILTIAGCTETVEGKPGWLLLMDKLTFRNGFDASKFGSGILKTIQLPREARFTTVTFQSKNERDLFSRNVEKKNQALKFFDSHPQPYRQPNKDMRKDAQNLRDMNYITDISIDESSLIMFLKYREKKKDKERFDWHIYETYDPFDPESIYNKSLKASKVLNKTALLIKPKYGTQVTQDILKAELEKFNSSNTNPLPSHNPVITDKNILIQFESKEDAASTKALLDTYNPNFLQGNCNGTLM